ncbi:MAG: hypothetical protein PHC61_08540 [Chitinivibrionales bacterium]|nr:hypothetical protein [Chitinivibrionales bacterium]
MNNIKLPLPEYNPLWIVFSSEISPQSEKLEVIKLEVVTKKDPITKEHDNDRSPEDNLKDPASFLTYSTKWAYRPKPDLSKLRPNWKP